MKQETIVDKVNAPARRIAVDEKIGDGVRVYRWRELWYVPQFARI